MQYLQYPGCWNSALDEHLKKIRFVQSNSDPCIYVSAEGEPFILSIYIDDILLAGKIEERITNKNCEECSGQ